MTLKLSTYLLSDYVPIYATLFQEMMNERAQYIIALSFQNLTISVQLENYLHQLAEENSSNIQGIFTISYFTYLEIEISEDISGITLKMRELKLQRKRRMDLHQNSIL